MGGPPELALAAILPALGAGLSSIGSGLLGGLGGLFGSPSNTVGGSIATNLGMQGVNGLLGKGGGQQPQLAGMSPPSQSPQFKQPQLGLGGQQAGGATQIPIPHMQVPQQMAAMQMGSMSQTPYQFGLPPMPEVSAITPPAGIDTPQLIGAQAGPMAGPTPPYAQQGMSAPEQYTQLLNYLRMNDLA